MSKTKVLVVCIGAMVRSVCLKQVYNGMYNRDALAASAVWQSPETMRMLCEWADVIVMVEPRTLPKGPEEYREKWMACAAWDSIYDAKRRVIDLGPDVWESPLDPGLQSLCREAVARGPFP